jgi:hypothetical protein
LLARERGGGKPYVSLLGSRAHTFFTDGARELFDCAGQGRVDVFFLSGGQIDGAGNINLVSVGDYAHPKARFPGSFGSAYLYYVVPKVILSARRAVAPPMCSGPAVRWRWSPTVACSSSTARAAAFASPVFIPGTALTR